MGSFLYTIFKKQTSSIIELLKWIAVLTMTIDHIGHICFPQNIILTTIGRIAFPLFGYILIHNYLYFTSNKKRYIIRLWVFGILSQPFFMYAIANRLNIFILLALALTSLYFFEKIDLKSKGIDSFLSKSLVVFIGLVLSTFGEYPVFGYLFLISLYPVFHGKMFFAPLMLISLAFNSFGVWYYTAGSFLAFVIILVAVLLIKENTFVIKRMNKWFFYGYYPFHMTGIKIFCILSLVYLIICMII